MEPSGTQNGQIPLILIHGAWLSAGSWENYADYFAKRGFDVSAPEWPRKHGDVEELRETAEASVGLGVEEIVDHYAKLIEALDQAPVLIGHSYGGLFVELLLDRGLGRAGVAMSPAPPKGVLKLPLSTLKAASPALAHPSKWHGVVTLTLQEFTYAFVNTFSEEEAAAAYERYAVPETGQIFYEGGIRQLPPAPRDRGPLQARGSSAAAPRRRGGGSHGSRVADQGAVQALRALSGPDGVRRVRGSTAPPHGRPGLAGGRRGGGQLARRRPRRAGGKERVAHAGAARPHGSATGWQGGGRHRSQQGHWVGDHRGAGRRGRLRCRGLALDGEPGRIWTE